MNTTYITNNNAAMFVDTDGHQLKLTTKAKSIEANLKSDCAICFEPLKCLVSIINCFNERQDIEPLLKQLSCYHIYHAECFNQLINHGTKSCPECRETITEEKVKTYNNTNAVIEDLPVECEVEYCTVSGKKEEIQHETPMCSYPLSTFPYQDAKNFLQNNHQEIQQWLRHEFSKKTKLSFVKSSYLEHGQLMSGREHIVGKPLIYITSPYNLKSKYESFYYSSVDINKGTNAIECFKNLLFDIRTDLMICFLSNSYPNMFDGASEAYIQHYDLWDKDAFIINIKGTVQNIRLSHIFNPVTKKFSWDNFKQSLGDKNYKLLLKKAQHKYPVSEMHGSYYPYGVPISASACLFGGISAQRGIMDSTDNYNSFNSNRSVEIYESYNNSQDDESTIDLPEGDLNMDDFMI